MQITSGSSISAARVYHSEQALHLTLAENREEHYSGLIATSLFTDHLKSIKIQTTGCVEYLSSNDTGCLKCKLRVVLDM